MNLRKSNLNFSTFFLLKDKKLSIEKAYTEGIYADTPANRKLGRVGMSYSTGKKEVDTETEEGVYADNARNRRLGRVGMSYSSDSKEKEEKPKEKAEEGVYADNARNRRLNRVGMTFSEWEEQQEKEGKSIDTVSIYHLEKILNKKEIYPMTIRDHGEYFIISLQDYSPKIKEKVAKETKETLEQELGAKVYISQNFHFVKAFKKDYIIEDSKAETFKIGKFEFDPNLKTLKKGKKKYNLTTKESELLEIFASNPNKFISRDALLEKIWGESNYYNSRSMDVYVNKLREKLSNDKDINLMTVHWKGFKMVVPKDKISQVQGNSKEQYIKDIVNKTEVLKELTDEQLDNVIEYINFDSDEIKLGIKEGAGIEEKREAIAEFYIDNAELEGEEDKISNDLDEIIEDALSDYVPEEKINEEIEEENVNKTSGKLSSTLTKINDYFGFEDEDGSWFADTPISLIMSGDREFGEIIDEFTDYQVLSQSGSYKNDGSRSNMLGCNVEYEIIPKNTLDEDIELNKKVFTVDSKTTIRDILNELK